MMTEIGHRGAGGDDDVSIVTTIFFTTQTTMPGAAPNQTIAILVGGAGPP